MRIFGNIIKDNFALYVGGGIGISESNFEISGNIIQNNIAGGDDESWGGGGMIVTGSGFEISYNLIAYNQAGNYPSPAGMGGGGILCWILYNRGTSYIVNNTFVGNRCLGYEANKGSGLWISGDEDSVYIVNNIFAHNEQGGLLKGSAQFITTDYNLFWQNDYGDYTGEIGSNNIFEDPLFVNPDSGDYSLQEDSPCIDAGNPNSPLDPDSTRADIGCYYYHHIVDVNDPDSLNSPHKFYLEQNYPNPFNGQTIISYYLPEDSDVELNIINMRGELVAKPVSSHQSAGNHSLIWQGNRTDGTPVATGIYFYELKVRDSHSQPSREVKAMILLK